MSEMNSLNYAKKKKSSVLCYSACNICTRSTCLVLNVKQPTGLQVYDMIFFLICVIYFVYLFQI